MLKKIKNTFMLWFIKTFCLSILCTQLSFAQSNWEWRNPLPQGNNLLSVTFGGGQLVCVGSKGTVLTSSDGINWNIRNSGTTEDLISVTAGNNQFVAVGMNGTVLTSKDGVNWTQNTLNSDHFNSITYGNNYFVATGYRGTIMTSTDGSIWTIEESDPAESLNSVTCNSNTFVAVGYNVVFTSVNNVWVKKHVEGNLQSVIYANSKFIAVGDKGKIMSSSDGSKWEEINSGVSQSLYNVTFADNKFLAVGERGIILYSSDGIIWEKKNSNKDLNLHSATYNGNQFVIAGDKGTLLTSANATEWIDRVSGISATFTSVTFGNGKFVTVGCGSGSILNSFDGVTWVDTKQEIGSCPNSLTYGKDRFVAVGSGITTSVDGAVWNPIDLLLPKLLSVNYGLSQFLTVGSSGEIYSSQDGIIWKSQYSGTSRNLRSVAFSPAVFEIVSFFPKEINYF
jgi:photosystem II stability/assembly factor-like uncharacterized protein